MPDPESNTLRAELFSSLYREVLSGQRTALIAERDAASLRTRRRGPYSSGSTCRSPGFRRAWKALLDSVDE
jgi:hypothetical protein